MYFFPLVRHGSCFRTSSTTSFAATSRRFSFSYRPRLFSTNSGSEVDVASTTDKTHGGRLRRGDLTSPDARSIERKEDVILSHLRSRRANEATIQSARDVAALNGRRVELIMAKDAALAERKTASAEVGRCMKEQNPEGAEEAKARSSAAGAAADAVEADLSELQERIDSMLAGIPNLLDDVVPDGADDEDNEEIYTWGSPDEISARMEWEDGFEPRWHDEIAAGLGGWQTDRAVRMSGSRFAALSGPTARLERALTSFFLDLHTTEHGYTEASVPLVISRSSLEGTGQLPKFEEDLFKIDGSSHTCNGQDAFLIPTAEVPLTNMHADEILEEDNLPIKYCAATPCFRAEAGSYGRDTRGLFRLHQFSKVELVKITSAETSEDEHEELTLHAEECLKRLKLPYRKVRLCSGDIGFSARHCYDLEVWLPGQGQYREVSSCSNVGDFQARRMGLRYRPNPPHTNESTDTNADGKNAKKKKKKNKAPKPVLCHTINGSGLAIGRALIGVLENYQRMDGSVVVPEVLVPYMGGAEVLMPTNNIDGKSSL